MITQIGIVAGEIWHYLDKEGEVLLSDIFSHLARNKHVILMSVGWLAREGHVILKREDSDFRVCLRRQDMKKAVALVIVWGVIILVSLFAIGAIRIMGNEAMIVEHKIQRMKAYYTARAATTYALEELRTGGDPSGTKPNFLNNLDVVIQVNPCAGGGCPASDLSEVVVTVNY